MSKTKLVKFQRPDGRQLQVEIIRFQRKTIDKPVMPDRHRHDFHSIFFILEGREVQEVDFEEYELSKGQVMLIPKGSVHWQKEAENLDCYVILFTDEFFSPAQKQLLTGFSQYVIATRKLLLNLTKEDQTIIKIYFELLFREQEDFDNPNHVFLLQNLILALLNKLESLAKRSGKNLPFLSHVVIFQRFIALLEIHYIQEKSVKFYTTELSITPKKLNLVLKAIIGQTAQTLIIDKVILEAKRLLYFSTQSIKQIAFGLGYEDQYYFSRIFKKKTKLNPEEFRQRYQL